MAELNSSGSDPHCHHHDSGSHCVHLHGDAAPDDDDATHLHHRHMCIAEGEAPSLRSSHSFTAKGGAEEGGVMPGFVQLAGAFCGRATTSTHCLEIALPLDCIVLAEALVPAVRAIKAAAIAEKASEEVLSSASEPLSDVSADKEHLWTELSKILALGSDDSLNSSSPEDSPAGRRRSLGTPEDGELERARHDLRQLELLLEKLQIDFDARGLLVESLQLQLDEVNRAGGLLVASLDSDAKLKEQYREFLGERDTQMAAVLAECDQLRTSNSALENEVAEASAHGGWLMQNLQAGSEHVARDIGQTIQNPCLKVGRSAERTEAFSIGAPVMIPRDASLSMACSDNGSLDVVYAAAGSQPPAELPNEGAAAHTCMSGGQGGHTLAGDQHPSPSESARMAAQTAAQASEFEIRDLRASLLRETENSKWASQELAAERETHHAAELHHQNLRAEGSDAAGVAAQTAAQQSAEEILDLRASVLLEKEKSKRASEEFAAEREGRQAAELCHQDLRAEVDRLSSHSLEVEIRETRSRSANAAYQERTCVLEDEIRRLERAGTSRAEVIRLRSDTAAPTPEHNAELKEAVLRAESAISECETARFELYSERQAHADLQCENKDTVSQLALVATQLRSELAASFSASQTSVEIGLIFSASDAHAELQSARTSKAGTSDEVVDTAHCDDIHRVSHAQAIVSPSSGSKSAPFDAERLPNNIAVAMTEVPRPSGLLDSRQDPRAARHDVLQAVPAVDQAVHHPHESMLERARAPKPLGRYTSKPQEVDYESKGAVKPVGLSRVLQSGQLSPRDIPQLGHTESYERLMHTNEQVDAGIVAGGYRDPRIPPVLFDVSVTYTGHGTIAPSMFTGPPTAFSPDSAWRQIPMAPPSRSSHVAAAGFASAYSPASSRAVLEAQVSSNPATPSFLQPVIASVVSPVGAASMLVDRNVVMILPASRSNVQPLAQQPKPSVVKVFASPVNSPRQLTRDVAHVRTMARSMSPFAPRGVHVGRNDDLQKAGSICARPGPQLRSQIEYSPRNTVPNDFASGSGAAPLRRGESFESNSTGCVLGGSSSFSAPSSAVRALPGGMTTAAVVASSPPSGSRLVPALSLNFGSRCTTSTAVAGTLGSPLSVQSAREPPNYGFSARVAATVGVQTCRPMVRRRFSDR